MNVTFEENITLNKISDKDILAYILKGGELYHQKEKEQIEAEKMLIPSSST